MPPKGRKKANNGPPSSPATQPHAVGCLATAFHGRSVAKPPPPLVGPVSVGAGMTAGLEIWKQGDRLVLVDRSADGRFADDVRTWDGVSGR